jgi:hypothetical protein
VVIGVLLQVHYQTGSMITSGVHVTAAPFKCDVHIHTDEKIRWTGNLKHPTAPIANEGESPVEGHKPR